MHPVPAIEVSQLVELRSYEIVPGGVPAFVEHFEAHFLASQEALGMDIVGQFTVPGDEARFVWIRRFLDPSGRADALAQFYGGPVWQEFGPRANELMVDHTDVHLLVPHPSGPAFAAGHVPHAQRGDVSDEPRTVVIAVYDLGDADLPAVAMSRALDGVPAAGVSELGRLVTAGVPNTFPRLPVHEDVTVGVWLLADPSGGAAAVATAQAVAAEGLSVRTMPVTATFRSTLG
jgi:hypothetical protein